MDDRTPTTAETDDLPIWTDVQETDISLLFEDMKLASTHARKFKDTYQGKIAEEIDKGSTDEERGSKLAAILADTNPL